jgi:exopolyphosphatase/guanosine-5'-triphosphate,3'-diphosphate pyrophosphatase
MAAPRKRTLTRKPKDGAPPPPPEPPKPYAAVDLGAAAVRLVIAEGEASERRIVEEASRGVLLGKDTFTDGRIGPATVDATLRALEGFRSLMDTFGVVRYRAVATSALREANNRDTVLDRIRVRTGIDVEIIDGSEENRLSYLAVREALGDHGALTAPFALIAEVGGGSADVSLLEQGVPVHSGTYPIGAVRLRQSFAAWQGTPSQFSKLLLRHITNVLEDMGRELPLRNATHMVAQGADVRLAARVLLEEPKERSFVEIPRDVFLRFCAEAAALDLETALRTYRLSQADSETLGPALLVYGELLRRTGADRVIVTSASLRHGVIADLSRAETGLGIEAFSRQVLASAHAVGLKYRYDEKHGRHIAHLAVRLFDELRSEHGLESRDRLLLEVAALLHDIGLFVNLRGHHKHSQYLIAAAEIFGLSREDLLVVSNIARYHRRALPQRSHPMYMALDRETKLVVNKLAALLRLANALDADHQQKVKDVRARPEEGAIALEVEGAGDLTMERLALLARSDFFQESFGRRVLFREAAPHAARSDS